MEQDNPASVRDGSGSGNKHVLPPRAPRISCPPKGPLGERGAPRPGLERRDPRALPDAAGTRIVTDLDNAPAFERALSRSPQTAPPGVHAGARISRTSERLLACPRSQAQLQGVPVPIAPFFQHTGRLGVSTASHSGPGLTFSLGRTGRGPGLHRVRRVARGMRAAGLRLALASWPPAAGSTALRSYSLPGCHGNFFLLIRTKHPPLLVAAEAS
jgi:hypothetical protein